jgi:hypothetical protein
MLFMNYLLTFMYAGIIFTSGGFNTTQSNTTDIPLGELFAEIETLGL